MRVLPVLAVSAVLTFTSLALAAPKKGGGGAKSAEPASASAPQAKSDPAAAERAFEKLKSLEGKWTATVQGKPSEAVFDVVAGKSAILQKSGFVTAYYLEDGALVGLTFTDDGNQPRLRSASGLSADGKAIDFEVTSVGNLKPGAGHMTGATFRFTDEDHLVQTIRWRDGGKDSSFDVTMSRNSASTLK